YRCRSGKCIPNDRICDGKFMDCEEGEDEDLGYCSRNHRCPATLPFKCDYGICIPERMMCDGSFNCLDASDELLCAKTACPADRSFKCNNGQCIEMAKVCNGIQDGCPDGSDEKNCTNMPCPPERNFKCNNGECIDRRLICDTHNDCQDNTDELICQTSTERMPVSSTPATSCPPDKFDCKNGGCIDLDKVCDGRKHCANAQDERKCKEFPCPSDRSFRCDDGKTCATPCDGFTNCKDKSDESSCSDSEKTETEIEIEPGTKVDLQDEKELEETSDPELEPEFKIKSTKATMPELDTELEPELKMKSTKATMTELDPELEPELKIKTTKATMPKDEPEETELENIDSILNEPEASEGKPNSVVEDDDKPVQGATKEKGSNNAARNIHGFTFNKFILLLLTCCFVTMS
ncbi:unnamed protein product, partial [Meganyctiphanes norvegica]